VNEFTYDGCELMAESIPLRELAEAFGTPLYVYSAASVRDHCRHIERAFEGYPHLSCYAVKANANPALLRLISAEGFGADVGSVGELKVALHAGFAADRITFSGVGKRDDEIETGLSSGVLAFNVESTEEISVISELARKAGKTARILLRLNLDIDAGGHAYISTSRKQNKFGIPSDRAIEVLRWAGALPGIAIGGIHSHIGSQITKEATFMRAAESIVELVNAIRAAGIPVEDLDFGGGFGVQYRGYVRHPSLPEETPEEAGLSASTLIRRALPILKKAECRLFIQPGRSVIAHSGVLLVKVLYRKTTDEKLFLVVDGGMNDLIRPSLYQSHHQIVPCTMEPRDHETADVVGPLCESGDFLALDRRIPRSERGEVLAVMCAGAYGYVLSSNYNARPRPAEVLVDGTERRIIRKRETVEQLYEE
jgi:diaminopimelate decarboxylase